MTDDTAPRRSYPAKILLYGEHTILRGGRGLAVPYPRYALRWTRGEVDPRLTAFAAYLGEQALDLVDADRFLQDARQGARLSGNIPTGYGLGSSGAVCAAVWDRYALSPARNDASIRHLRAALSRLESYFHGSSSGTDPLISFLDRPLLLSGGGDAGAVELPGGWAGNFFLIDTATERTAAPLIHQFLEAYARAPESIRENWLLPAERAIEAIVRGDRTALYAATAQISDFQLTHFPQFIPDPCHAVWDGGHAYRLKLCGAGGGGMLLGLAKDRRVAESTFGAQLSWL